MKSALIYLASLLLFVIVLGAESEDDTKTNKEIIKFSHSVHAELATCAGCHTNVPESASLNDKLLPEKAACAECHDVEDDENCTMCHYEDNFAALVEPSSELIFSHKRHYNAEDKNCEQCHIGMTQAEYGFELINGNPSMGTCSGCHTEDGPAVSTTVCESCHISTFDLTPENHKTVSFMKQHKFMSASESAECAMCHNSDFCESCHVGTTAMTEGNVKDDFYAPYSPHTYVDGTKQQQITRVHDLNFRFTHGIDAKGKTNECATCHQEESFCVTCHSGAAEDYATEGFMPSSHRVSDFIVLGVGSGGGQHAKFARRDIENCAACHDINGADPSCILCHSDPDGIKGTNPKTHKINFMKDIDGDWHNDEGSVCFTCHQDANARPEGQSGLLFCGYCHGQN
ncbi:MAG: cytochrome C [Ignavibacteriales bacterium]|nr:cytochrome C [Ignavibacteriales bacterium]MCF8305781.1 cytochrome C [Ignavibacteriales bacterium]MCF8315503.1 cytochrome C [Ignavibacteriales bacterium]MCF8436968.1 cytochrome C [Ignavibacteriales bacterium]